MAHEKNEKRKEAEQGNIMGIPPIITGAPHHLVTHHIGMMAGMGVHRRKRIVTRN